MIAIWALLGLIGYFLLKIFKPEQIKNLNMDLDLCLLLFLGFGFLSFLISLHLMFKKI